MALHKHQRGRTRDPDRRGRALRTSVSARASRRRRSPRRRCVNPPVHEAAAERGVACPYCMASTMPAATSPIAATATAKHDRRRSGGATEQRRRTARAARSARRSSPASSASASTAVAVGLALNGEASAPFIGMNRGGVRRIESRMPRPRRGSMPSIASATTSGATREAFDPASGRAAPADRRRSGPFMIALEEPQHVRRREHDRDQRDDRRPHEAGLDRCR